MNVYLNIFLALFLTCCQSAIKSSSDSINTDEFFFFEKSYTELSKAYPSLVDEGEVAINRKNFFQKSLYLPKKYKVEFLIEKETMTIAEITKMNIDAAYKNSFNLFILDQSFQPKCVNKANTLKFSLPEKAMALINNNQIVFYAKSILIEDRIQENHDKACLNRWGH